MFLNKNIPENRDFHKNVLQNGNILTIFAIVWQKKHFHGKFLRKSSWKYEKYFFMETQYSTPKGKKMWQTNQNLNIQQKNTIMLYLSYITQPYRQRDRRWKSEFIRAWQILRKRKNTVIFCHKVVPIPGQNILLQQSTAWY